MGAALCLSISFGEGAPSARRGQPQDAEPLPQAWEQLGSLVSCSLGIDGSHTPTPHTPGRGICAWGQEEAGERRRAWLQPSPKSRSFLNRYLPCPHPWGPR